MNPNIIDQMLDKISQLTKEKQQWETIAHQLADALTKNDKQQETLHHYHTIKTNRPNDLPENSQ